MKANNPYRLDFPLIANSKCAYLDSGATSQKPSSVIARMEYFYENENANPHRSVYKLSENATVIYEDARKTVADFIGGSSEEIVFTKNATEALNLIALSYGNSVIEKDDEIVMSIMEHHSNLVPWQMLAKNKGAKLKYLYLDKDYNIPDSELAKITDKTKIVAITLVSNVLGTIVDVKKIADIAHKKGARVVVDATQATAHIPVNVDTLGADFLVLSGHKMYAPLGIGVLYGRKNLLDNMNPLFYGGDMIEYVYEQDTTFAPTPTKFEAGTQNIAGAVGLASAIDYLNHIGWDKIRETEDEIMGYALEKLNALPFMQLYVPSQRKNHTCVISFNIKNIHAHDVASFLSSENVCVRSGNHCAQPLLRYLGLESTCRLTVSIYNNKDDIDRLVKALENVYNKFKKYIER